jgi:hypothetical protein
MSVQGVAAVAAVFGRIQETLESGGELFYVVAAAARDEGARYAAFIVPKDTGSLSMAQQVFIEGDVTIIGTDPDVVNPKSHTLPLIYGPVVAMSHFDFYGQVVADRGDAIVARTFQEWTAAIGGAQ